MTVLTLGGIYETDSRWQTPPNPFSQPKVEQDLKRIIGFDDNLVFYDSYSNELEFWLIASNLKRQTFFYRIEASFFSESTKLVGFQPLSDEETSIFRPDLPPIFCRILNLNWQQIANMDYEDFGVELSNLSKTTPLLYPTLACSEIFLHPRRKNGYVVVKGQHLKARNGLFFEATELIWAAAKIQQAHYDWPSEGISLERMGYQKRIPSFATDKFIKWSGLV